MTVGTDREFGVSQAVEQLPENEMCGSYSGERLFIRLPLYVMRFLTISMKCSVLLYMLYEILYKDSKTQF